MLTKSYVKDIGLSQHGAFLFNSAWITGKRSGLENRSYLSGVTSRRLTYPVARDPQVARMPDSASTWRCMCRMAVYASTRSTSGMESIFVRSA